MFYQLNDTQWCGTLIKLRKSSANSFQMKIYNRQRAKIIALLQTIRTEFIDKMTISIVDTTTSTNIMFDKLQHAFKEEFDFYIKSIRDKELNASSVKRNELVRNLCDYQLKTDLLLGEIQRC